MKKRKGASKAGPNMNFCCSLWKYSYKTDFMIFLTDLKFCDFPYRFKILCKNVDYGYRSI